MEFIMLSFSLSLDALGIGTSLGLRNISLPKSSKAVVFGASAVITASAVYFGEFLRGILPEKAASFTGIIILFGMGIWVFCQSMGMSCAQNEDSLGAQAGRILCEPENCDNNASKKIEPTEALMLSFILSLDSFGVSLGIAASGKSALWLPFIMSAAQIFFLTLGNSWGAKIFPSKKINSFGGAFSSFILIGMGLLRLMETFC